MAVARVTRHYSISGSVDFLDVHVERDNRLYVDPSAVRFWAAQGDPWSGQAYAAIEDFFDEVLRRLFAGTAADAAVGQQLLSEFHEPRETRLGMSAEGFDGSGASRILGERIWQSLVNNPLCTLHVPILRRLEDIPLFVDDIANDRVSDLTTRVIFNELVAFTEAQMLKHPELTSTTVTRSLQFWDGATKRWTERSVELPRVVWKGRKDSPLVLVPKRIVHRNLRMAAGKYWQREVLGSVQDERTRVSSDGRRLKPRKDDLKLLDEFKEVRATNTRRTLQVWNRDETNLLQRYRDLVDSEFAPLSEAEIHQRLG